MFTMPAGAPPLSVLRFAPPRRRQPSSTSPAPHALRPDAQYSAHLPAPLPPPHAIFDHHAHTAAVLPHPRTVPIAASPASAHASGRKSLSTAPVYPHSALRTQHSALSTQHS